MTERRVSTTSIELAGFIRSSRYAIMGEWNARARAAGIVTEAAVVDDIPLVLGHVADLVDEIAKREPADPYFEMARRQACERFHNGVHASAVVNGLSLLRASLWTVWQRQHGAPALNELQPIDLAIDAAIAASVMRSEEAKQQALESALGKLESLLAASPIGIAFLDRELRYLRINDALAAIIGNALKFCRAGDTIRIDCALDGNDVRFSVSDSGPGIPPEQLARVIEPYWSGSRARGGAGLGLFISRGVVERHGGQLTVDSVVGEGSRFSFTIPVAVDQ